ncbi:MAG TPA: MCP four helix bundle domain-containing protein [Nevskiaceae bacterium]|nr:MCP four helix bundle domain-containing protein [Nevskiaceae bacterium]
MSPWTIRHRIILSFAIVVGVILRTSALIQRRLESIRHDAGNILAQSLPGLYQSAQMSFEWELNQELTGEYAIQVQKNGRNDVGAQLQANWKAFAGSLRLYQDTVDTSDEQRQFEDLRSQLAQYQRLRATALFGSGAGR